ncbi:ORF1270 [White spot syndrome virus]|uniref:ORF1270 n=1 Tax=White spot syndrome virus TaxID=342409 RepID=A0A2D3I642_9VIRU|nr:ORF1270 [White spot syndrome virus]
MDPLAIPITLLQWEVPSTSLQFLYQHRNLYLFPRVWFLLIKAQTLFLFAPHQRLMYQLSNSCLRLDTLPRQFLNVNEYL